MKYDFVFYLTDESFDYNGPFGTETQVDYAPHGFEIGSDLDISSLRGYGDFAYMENNIKTKDALKNFIKDNIWLINEVNPRTLFHFTTTNPYPIGSTNRDKFLNLINNI